jgi:hypothetical protein
MKKEMSLMVTNLMALKSKSLTVKNGAKMTKKNGMRSGVKFTSQATRLNGATNGKLKFQQASRKVKTGVKHTQMTIKSKSIGLKSGTIDILKTVGFMKKDMNMDLNDFL